MKIVSIRGGLGNQMFQYAFAIALQQKYPDEKVLLDTQLYRFPFVKTFKGNNFYHNGFEINEVFPKASLPIASFKEVAKVSYYIPNYIFNRALRKILPQRKTEFFQESGDAYMFDKKVLDIPGISFYEGYWFSPMFYDSCREKILEAFEFRPFKTKENQAMMDDLKKDNSVTIHIRRGDYLNVPHLNNICTLDYYRNAIVEVRKKIEKPIFFIFSNDQKWCMENLKGVLGDNVAHYVNNNRGRESYRDMQLMSLARCNVLANSSFSWWGAYLNQRKDHIVYTPQKWASIKCDDACCAEWIKV